VNLPPHWGELGRSRCVFLQRGIAVVTIEQGLLAPAASKSVAAVPSAVSPSLIASGVARARPFGHPLDFSGVQVAVLLVALALVASIPVLTHPLPPIGDYANHLARMHVIAATPSDPDLNRFYGIQWQIIPNLMMDAVVPKLAQVMGIYRAGQVFVIATLVLIISGTLALNRALFGKWSVLPLAALPLLYNYVFLVGVMNYVFGIGLALWALALWIWLRERGWPLRLLVSTAFVLMLFFCHLFAIGLYGIGLLAIELQRLWTLRRGPLVSPVADFLATGLPFLPIVPLLVASPTWRLSGENYWEPLGKLAGLTYIIEVYSDIVAFALIAIFAVAIAWGVRNRLRLHPVGWVLLAVGGLIYLVLPNVLFATYMADQRLPIALAFMVIACLNLPLRHELVRLGFLALVLIALTVRVIEVDVYWTDLSRATLDFRDSVKRMKRGSTVLVAYADSSAGDDVRDFGLIHAACLAIIERSALVTTAFTVPGKQIMQVQPAYRDRVDSEDGTPPSLEQLLLAADGRISEEPAYWENWRSQFDYVYLLFTEQDAEDPAPEFLKLVHDGGRFRLYSVVKPK
jgi:hypothetical protein